MSLALPSPASRRGACPSLDSPMQTGDGLLARLRVAGGALTPNQLSALAGLAEEYGNGLVEITARGNLQVRGLTPASSSPFARAVEAVVAIERGLVVETPPLAGADPAELADPRPLAASIRELPLRQDRLGPKVTVTVDGNGQLSVAELKADIAVLAVAPDGWLLTVAGTSYGPFARDEAIDHVGGLLGSVAEQGATARAGDLAPMLIRLRLGQPVTRSRFSPGSAMVPVGRFATLGDPAVGVALPFGAIGAPSLQALASASEALGIAMLRLAPHRCLLAMAAPAAFAASASALGLVTRPADPRFRVSACVGSEGCASGLIPARTLAARVAPALPAGTTLHVSGCTKGCAHPRRAGLTLVGTAAGTGLVIGGAAGDTPAMMLSDHQIESAIRAAGRG